MGVLGQLSEAPTVRVKWPIGVALFAGAAIVSAVVVVGYGRRPFPWAAWERAWRARTESVPDLMSLQEQSRSHAVNSALDLAEIRLHGACRHFAVDDGLKLFKQGDSVYSQGLGIGWRAATSTAGHKHLQELLLSDDPVEVQYAAIAIHAACDFRDIPLLMSAATKHVADADVVARCLDSIESIVYRDDLADHFRRKGSCEEQLREMQVWLSSQGLLVPGNHSFEEWHLPWILYNVRRLTSMDPRDVEHKDRVMAGNALLLLQCSPSPRAVPVLMRSLEAMGDLNDAELLIGAMMLLEIFVGDVNRPRGGDLQTCLIRRRELLAWWKSAAAETPAEWVAHFLAKRQVHVELRDPEKTLDLVEEMLQKEDRYSQYTACLLLHYAYPGGSLLPMPPQEIIYYSDGSRSQRSWAWPVQLSSRRSQAAYVRLFVDALSWDENLGRYIIGNRSKTEEPPEE
jgi:hypothetical protein